MMNTDESTQASLRLMDKIRASRLFTMPTSLGEMKLTQRDTNLCVPIAGSRLIRIVRFDATLFEHWVKSSNLFFVIVSIIRTIISFAFIAILPNIIKPSKRQQLEVICDEIKRFPIFDPKKKNESSAGPSSGKFLT